MPVGSRSLILLEEFTQFFHFKVDGLELFMNGVKCIILYFLKVTRFLELLFICPDEVRIIE